MKNIFIFVLIAFTLALGITTKVAATEVVLIGGSVASPADVVTKAEKAFGGTFIELGRHWPLSSAAANILQQLKEKNIDMSNGIVLVGYSWGGLVARQLDADNPGLVKMVVTIGSVSGGYRFMPEGFFMPSDRKSRTPLYVIGGYDPQIPKKWFMQGKLNDGIVSLESVLTVGRSTIDTAVFSGFEHTALMVSPEVTNQIREWIAHESSEKTILVSRK
ncbi:MAG: hypothetical protein NUV49_04185 [Patescibacteria group bacterium]|nr:hypothetical protein [Patescibacteria group bacterium]